MFSHLNKVFGQPRRLQKGIVINMAVYNENRDKNNSMYDEIREQNAKLKGAPLKDKWEYFKDYYLKGTIIGVVALILIGSIAYTIATAPDDTAFAAVFFNDTGDSSNTELCDRFCEYHGINTDEHYAYIDSTYSYDSEVMDYENGVIGIQKVSALIAAKELDIIAGDYEAFDYYAQSDAFHNLEDIMSKEQLEKYSDKIYYYTNPETGVSTPCGIIISDAPKIQEYHYYDDVEAVMGFLVNSDSIDNALAFLDYIYEEE